MSETEHEPDEAPSGLPDPAVEDQPLGPAPDDDADEVALPGVPDGEPPSGG